MKIFFFITKSEHGGAQTHVAQLTNFFVSRGDHVCIMSMPGGWLEREAKKLGAQFFSNTALGNTLNPLRLWRAHILFLKAVKQFNPDIVACHSTIAGLVGRLSLKQRVPTVFTAHGWGFTQGSSYCRRLILPYLERLAGTFSDKIICVSKNDIDLAWKQKIALKEKMILVYNGVTIPNTAKKHQKKTDIVKIIFIGRLSKPKEPLRLLQSYIQLPKEIRGKSSIEIIGSGSQKSSLRKFIRVHGIEKQVLLLGDIPHKEVSTLLTQADIFVLPSRWEGFPYAILEAMVCKLPVIASNVGGIAEEIDGSGILIPSGDTAALTNALRELISNPLLRKDLGNKGFMRVSENFSVEKMCQKTLAVYQSILDSHKT